jgi:hypothetical protein
MTPGERQIEQIKFKRFRTLGTANPFCATCGECRWWVRYERHHIAGRRYSEELIQLCLNCHDGISIMQRLLPPLDDCPDPRLAKLIATLEGSALLHDMAAANQREVAELLRLDAHSKAAPDQGSAA